ncbi:MAG: response regulator [Patescibacteria group bacterium]
MKKKGLIGKILIIEDDEPTREATILKFSQAGYAVDFAGDGEDGLKKLRKGKFTGVLLDLRLPKIDGFIFLERKREVEALREIPVMVFSNFSQVEFIDRALDLGAKGYLIKAQHSVQEIVEETINCFVKGQCQIDR